jgi:hypothetical protein
MKGMRGDPVAAALIGGSAGGMTTRDGETTGHVASLF